MKPASIFYTAFAILSYFSVTTKVFPSNTDNSNIKTQESKAESIEWLHDAIKNGQPGPIMIKIQPGKFIMGSENKLSVGYEKPIHEVSISYSYYMSQYPVTFDDYDKYTNATGKSLVDDFNWGRGTRPVINVNQQDAIDYALWLSQQTGHKYRLPSEAEWEYANRAGTTSNYPWSDEFQKGMANCKRCGTKWDTKMTSPVGQFPANPWGLYDMQGNVWELTADCWNFTYNNAPIDGSAWRTGDCTRTVLRGGSFGDPPADLRSSTRLRSYSGTRTIVIGFRLVREN